MKDIEIILSNLNNTQDVPSKGLKKSLNVTLKDM